MRIVDVDESTRPLFCQCLEDWSDDVKEAGVRRARWVDGFTPPGVCAPSSRSTMPARPAG